MHPYEGYEIFHALTIFVHLFAFAWVRESYRLAERGRGLKVLLKFSRININAPLFKKNPLL